MVDREDNLKLEYLYGGEVVYQPGEGLSERLLTDYECVYIISGDATYIANGEAFAVPQGSVVFGLPGTHEQYQWDPVRVTHHAFFHFSMEATPAYWTAPECWPRIHVDPNPLAVSLFRHILTRIYEHNNWPAEPPALRDAMLVQTLIDTCLESRGEDEQRFAPVRPEPVRRALKWMRQRIDDDPSWRFSLDDIAAQAGCTPKHLCRVFKQSTGHSPARTGTLMRLQLAIALLARSNLTIQQIAHRCGFENPLYFSRCFAREFGRPPSQVRADIAAGVPPPPDPLPVDITPRVHW